MDNLVDAFCDAVEAWGRETGAEGRNAVIWVMGWTGGDRHVEALGKTDTTGMSEEEIAKLKIGELRGNHSVEQMREWLHYLTDSLHIADWFLIPALFNAVGDRLEGLAHDYGKGLRNRRRDAEQLTEMAAEETDPAKKEDLVGLADWLGQGGSLTEMRDRKHAYEAWQRIVAPLASRQTIDAAIRERMERRFG
jgi:hypothetical protein